MAITHNWESGVEDWSNIWDHMILGGIVQLDNQSYNIWFAYSVLGQKEEERISWALLLLPEFYMYFAL